MDKTASELLDETIGAIKLKILVFGPQVHTRGTDDRTLNHQDKRIEIRQALEVLGHKVKYAEDLRDPSLTGPIANPFIQEHVIMNDYDLIVILVWSPGTIVEATMIADRPLLARKTALFLDNQFIGGLVAGTCEHAANIGAYFQTYTYPNDLTQCNLLGFVRSRVDAIQIMKYLL